MLFLDSIVEYITTFAPNIAQALLVLVVGFLLARIAAGVSTRALGVAGLNAKIAEMFKVDAADADHMVKENLYYVMMFFVVVAVFAALGVTVLANLMTGMGLFVAFILILALAFFLDLGEKAETVMKKVPR